MAAEYATVLFLLCVLPFVLSTEKNFTLESCPGDLPHLPLIINSESGYIDGVTINSDTKHCSWIVGFPRLVSVYLDFIDFDCEKSDIFLRRRQFNQSLCNSTERNVFLTFDNSFMLSLTVFKKGVSKSRVRFRFQACIFYKNVPADATNVAITSVGYPSAAAPFVNCEWHVRTEEGYNFYIHILELTLQKSKNCANGKFVLDEFGLKYLHSACRTQTNPVVRISNPNKFIIRLIIKPTNKEAKFKILVSSMKVPEMTHMNLTGSKVTTSYIESQQFPGPFPIGRKFDWLVANRGQTAVYLESFNASGSSCSETTLSARYYKELTVCPNTKLGYLGTSGAWYWRLKTMSPSFKGFRLRLEHTDGKWSDLKRITDCPVKCGKSHVLWSQSCDSPPPTVKDAGCFLKDGRNRSMTYTFPYRCGRLCIKSDEETWYSVSFELKFSEAINLTQFNEVVGPAIKSFVVNSLNRYCNKNASACCVGSTSWKKRNPALTYNFIAVDGIRFTKDTPTIQNNVVGTSFFAVPKKDNELCSGQTSLRRKRSVPATTPASPTAGALPKDVLFAAIVNTDKNEIIVAVSAALRSQNINVNVSFSKSPHKVPSFGHPPRPTRPPWKPEGINYFLVIGVPLITVIGGSILGCIVRAVWKCCSSFRNASASGEGTVVYTKARSV